MFALCSGMITRRTVERVTDLEGRFLHYITRTSRRPWVRIVTGCPPFEDKVAVFEIETKPGKPDRWLRRIG
jgi:hypothetical protein